MTDIGAPFFQWLNAHPELAGLFTFIISAAESVAIIGTIVPGTIMMTAIGTLAGAGIIPLYQTIVWAILGAIVGDGISYWLGHFFKDKLPQYWPFRTNPYLLKTGAKFVHKYGSMSVFIGRFVGPVRALVPMTAGMLGMKPLRFTIANVTSAIGWAPAYMLPGIMLGAASQELPPDIAMHVMLVLLFISLIIILCFWFLYKLLQLVQTQITQLQNWIWHHLKRTSFLKPITVLLKHHNMHKTHGQLSLALLLIITSLLFAGLTMYVKYKTAANIMVNDALYHLFRSIRNTTADTIMLNITLLGQKEVILPLIVTLFALLAFWKRWRIAFHVLALGILAAGSAYILKMMIQSPRPWGIFQNAESYSMPSGHATLATTLYVGLAFLIALSVRPKYRWPIYTCSIIVALAVGISRLYLGAHWFTDVVASWLLSTVILLVVVISFERQREKHMNPGGILIVSLLTLLLTFGVYHHKHMRQLTINYGQVSWPTVELPMNEWWTKNDAMPAYRTSLFGFPSQRMNIEWTGDLEQIRETLSKEGWSKPPARDWISTIHRITDINSTEYLPMVSPQYLDNKPALILTRGANANGDTPNGLLVIRLWDANRLIQESHKPIWVGFVSVVPRSYSWIFKKHPGEIEIDPVLVFPHKTGSADWQWKIIDLHLENGTKRPINQQIMLVRPTISAHKKI